MLDKLEEIVASRPGAKIVGLTTQTEPKLLKKSRKTGEPTPFGSVVRKTERVAVLACQYESCVNRQLEREDKPAEFVAGALWNGKGRHVEGHPFLVEHTETGKRYIAIMPLQTHRDWWEADGKPIDPVLLAEYLPKPGKNESQGTDKPVLWRTVAVDNVLAARYAGEEYTPLLKEAA
jgi:hypothetical protein